MKKNTIIIVATIAVTLTSLLGCGTGNARWNRSQQELSFWGDSATAYILEGKNNGYKISIFTNEDLYIIHFQRGDSINRYCALHDLPDEIRRYPIDSAGVYNIKMDFPVLQLDTIGDPEDIPDMFFMDVNFDDEEEFVVLTPGYNRHYLVCFDLVNGNMGNSCPGLLDCLSKEPYNNIVCSTYGYGYTVFDRDKKEIYINEHMGASSCYEIWARKDSEDYFENVKVFKIVESSIYGDNVETGESGYEHVITYERQNDSLKVVSDEKLYFDQM